MLLFSTSSLRLGAWWAISAGWGVRCCAFEAGSWLGCGWWVASGGGGALAGDTTSIYFCATRVLYLSDDRYRGTREYGDQRGDARELGHSYLRLGLGLGLFLPAHFLQQGPLRFWVAAGRVAGRVARRAWW
jgi:hypothetical protein